MMAITQYIFNEHNDDFGTHIPIQYSECYFNICRDFYIGVVKMGDRICSGCKEPYK